MPGVMCGYPLSMEPIPETLAALEELGPTTGDAIHDEILRVGTLVRHLVPSCVGLSMAVYDFDLTFTAVATDDEIRALDASQYLDSGPCIEAAESGQVVEVDDTSALNEASWQIFAQATSHAGIKSTLTVPIRQDDEVIGTFNLYAVDPDAFRDTRDAVVSLLGGWHGQSVENADLDFTTRRAAEQAPRKLAQDAQIDLAAGMIMAARQMSRGEAMELMAQAAQRAGIEVHEVARIITDIRDPR